MMNNREKYDEAFIETFGLKQDQLNSSLEYQSINAWDSVGHMALIAELEDVFDIMLEMDDIVDFGSYETGIKTMGKYGVDI
jgi:acyl carrier protein